MKVKTPPEFGSLGKAYMQGKQAVFQEVHVETVYFPSAAVSVQDECIPQAILGMDVICQAKSGMGKTAVFVIATLQQLEPVDGQVSVLVMCHAR